MAEETPVEVNKDISDIASFDLTEKKKKKKLQPQDQDQTDDFVDNLAEEIESLTINDEIEGSFFDIKKKKRPVEEISFIDKNGDPELDYNGQGRRKEFALFQYPWEETDRDYVYEELLSRAFNLLRENDPELAGDRCRTVMRPPMHREAEDVMTFLLAEMGTSESLDGQQLLVVKDEYVICNGCKSPDTILMKENCFLLFGCEQCGSVWSVAPMKAGFIARVGCRNPGT